jgi:hypothetical protein
LIRFRKAKKKREESKRKRMIMIGMEAAIVEVRVKVVEAVTLILKMIMRRSTMTSSTAAVDTVRTRKTTTRLRCWIREVRI